ncbi:MAG: peptide chain release factor N(5)-glutamine methyltransferase [Polyangiaceae bacterium]
MSAVVAAEKHEGPWTIETLVRWATEDFRGRGIESPRLDAEVLLAFALGSTRMQLIIDAKRELEEGELTRFRELVKRRRKKEPVAYVRGEREFYGRNFRVDRRVLVPRPDTETLVEVALKRTTHVSMCMRALDLCTGSGCVALTLGRERPTSQIFATDISRDALEVARHNALRLGAYNVAFVEGDLFAPVAAASAARFDIIVSNPPYIPHAEIATLMPDVRDFEPLLALDGGADGLDLIRRIIADAPRFLVRGGVLAMEVGAGEAGPVQELFTARGFTSVSATRDYGRIERIVDGVWSAAAE